MAGFPTTTFRFEGTWDEWVRTAGDIQHGTAEEAPQFRSDFGVPASMQIKAQYPALVTNGNMALIIREYGPGQKNHAFYLSVLHATGLTEADITQGISGV